MSNLQNKKILLFIPRGRGIYGTGIASELENRGATVYVYDERPSQTTVSKIALRLAKSRMEPWLQSYYFGIFEQHAGDAIDYVFVVRGEGLTPRITAKMRKSFPGARFILYLWDSIKNNDTAAIFDFFDRILSFDKEDVENYPGLVHRPLFFLPEYREIASKEPGSIDLLFIGTAHNDRYTIIKKLEPLVEKHGLKTFFYFYFPSRLLYFQKKLTDQAFRNTRSHDFQFKMMPAQKASDYMSRSRASLDVEGPGQTGLTMRTIEVLGARRKLITTNTTIKSYDFYNEDNILIIDRKKPEIDVSFIESPCLEISEKIYHRYSLEGWIDDIFCGTH